jgi:uncharacterized protein (TIGR03790 family)
MRALKTQRVLIFLLALSSYGANPERVIILANSADAESLELANYYAAQRVIPEANIIALPMSTKETISIHEYVEEVHNPLLNALLNRKWLTGSLSANPDFYGRDWLVAGIHEIDYLVTMKGVPLRIANSPELLGAVNTQTPEKFRVNCSSLDSELALLTVSGQRSLTAYTINPHFKNRRPNDHIWRTYLRVSRLDGPSKASVKALIDRSLEAESNGLQGRAYFDIGGPHAEGDRWFREASELSKAAFFDTSIESTKQLMDARNRFDAPAIYMGWYSRRAYGHFLNPSWTVPPGSVALHLHSFSGTTVRNAQSDWVGPLLNMGFCATVGNVYEPYLKLTHHPQLLLEVLLDGGTFGEAVHYSINNYGWMGFAIGDPLYRPFKQSLSKQVKAGPSAYVVLREMHRILSEENRNAAIAYLRKAFQEAPSLPLVYALGDIYVKAGQKQQAREVLRLLEYINIFAKEDRVLVFQIANLLSDIEAHSLALKLYKNLLGTADLDKAFRIITLEMGISAADAAKSYPQAERWRQELLLLKTPTPKT